MSRSDMLPLWTDAYLADTMHLNNEHHGCYLKLLIFAWRQPDCRIKDCNLVLKNVLGVTPKKLTTLKPVLMDFWELKDGYYFQKRLSREHKKRRDYIDGKKQKSLEDANFEDAKSSETSAKKVNENNETDTLAEAVAVADINYSSLSARDVVEIQSALMDAAGEGVKPNSPQIAVIQEPLRWITGVNPCDFALDVIPTVQRIGMRNRGSPKGSWSYFRDAVMEARDLRLAGNPKPKEIENGNRNQNNQPKRNPVSNAQDARRDAWREVLARRADEGVPSKVCIDAGLAEGQTAKAGN